MESFLALCLPGAVVRLFGSGLLCGQYTSFDKVDGQHLSDYDTTSYI